MSLGHQKSLKSREFSFIPRSIFLSLYCIHKGVILHGITLSTAETIVFIIKILQSLSKMKHFSPAADIWYNYGWHFLN